MALPDLIARLDQDARSQVEAINARAEADVAGIAAAAARAVADTAAAASSHRRAEREAVSQRELAAARREARAAELVARRALLERILVRARDLLPAAARSPRYRETLPSHVKQALAYVEGLPVEVRCPAELEPVVASVIEGRADVALVTDESAGPGVVVRATNGSVAIDNTLAARLARLESRLSVELMAEVGRAGD